jgi:hypothetical protein
LPTSACEIVGVNPETRAVRWRYLSGHEYHLPTTAKQLVRIDVRSGEFSEPVKTRGILGNLACHKDAVISQGVNRVTAFCQVDSLLRRTDDPTTTRPR